MVTELEKTLVDSMISSIASAFGDVGEEEVAEIRKKVLPETQAQFDNPEELRQKMYKQARNEYMSVRQLKAGLRHHLAYMRKDEEIGKDVAADYEKAYDGLFEFVRTNDRIIRRLAKIAETDGIDKATQKNTRNSVIRDMFPTPDEYMAFAQRGTEAVRNFYQQTQTALMADGKMGQALGGMFGSVGKAIEKYQEMVQKIQGNYLEKAIREIYI
jgi:hypothetical protein